MVKNALVKDLPISDNPSYFHRATYKRIAAHNRLIPLTSLKKLNLGSKEEVDLDEICEIVLISEDNFSDRDADLVLRVHTPINAKSYSMFRYNGKDQSVLSLRFY